MHRVVKTRICRGEALLRFFFFPATEFNKGPPLLASDWPQQYLPLGVVLLVSKPNPLTITQSEASTRGSMRNSVVENEI